ncbi:MAG: MarR family transcriptional regulator [Gammaproteobacteria bacterium]|jgi:DNA-binding MarR family transcriptional regulator
MTGRKTQQTDYPDNDDRPQNGSHQEDIAQSVVQDIRVVVRTIQAHSRSIEKQCGVSAVQLWAMWELFARPGQRVSDLSNALSIHQSTASNMLDKLESRELIRRERNGGDQRVVRLNLTEKGRQLLSGAPRPAQGAVRDALTRMSVEELKQLQTGLETLMRYLPAASDEAALNPI